MMKKALFSVGLITISIWSCKKATVECDGSTPTYTSEVKTILDANCASCHGAGSTKGDYSTYQKLKVVVDNGKFEREVIINQSMPRGGKMEMSQLSKLKCWLENGAPEN
jgi:mono/diheme cytochrome c family protein